jgi:D-alanyl-D-alanine carboxypeptidase (penicillin-binding protein 5/6)
MIRSPLFGHLCLAFTLLFALQSRLTAADLADELQPLIDDHRGEVSVAIKNLETGETFLHEADRPMPTASLIKLPLMVAAYRAVADGKVSLDQPIVLREEDKVPGSGILTDHFSPGTTISLRDAIRLMIVYSDNTATNLVVEQVGLPATAELMERLGLPNTKLHSKVYRGDTTIFPERSKEFGLGSTTAGEMMQLLELVSGKKLIDAASCDGMAAHLYACDDKLKFRRFLSDAKIAYKTGSVNAVRTAAGWIDSPAGRIAVCVLTSGNKDQSWGDRNQGDLLCARIAEAAYKHFNPEEEPSPPDGSPLKLGANGPLVKALQQTLNARMSPPPDLTVDGDFGPATEGAVIAFQRSQGLEANGTMGPRTWGALGPLVEDDSEPEPEEVIEKKPADPLEGPPFLTCKAWAIADADTGEILWQHESDKPLDIASTTKMMTAHLVAGYAARHPEALDEVVTFSGRADRTIGSTADVRIGEQVAARDLLYGLMLPSGNDASVALAEHFGERLAPNGWMANETDSAARRGYEAFVAAMNAEAARLGMEETHYENTHGLSARRHKSSAGDLLILAREAMQQPLFCELVSTPRHECVVTGPGGYQRRIVWRNTNRLLGIEGYEGVKTGTTTLAGACLVSKGSRDGRSLLVSVLGASSSDGRYADTRNLYRWAWTQVAASASTPASSNAD